MMFLAAVFVGSLVGLVPSGWWIVASKAPAVKAALYALCQTLYPAPIQVCLRAPGHRP